MEAGRLCLPLLRLLELTAPMCALYTNAGCRDLPGMALARRGLGARGGRDPGCSVPTLGLETRV